MSVLRRVRTVFTFGIGLGGAALLAAESPELQIRALSPQGSVEYDESTGIIADPAGVAVSYGDTTLTARRITLDRNSTAIEAEGNVRLQRDREIWTGERLRYNFVTREIDAANFRTGMIPFFATGQGVHADLGKSSHSATGGMLTTDDVAEPGYRVKAARLAFLPGKYVEAEKAVLYVGRVPVMYLPKYRRHFDRHPNNFVFVPGYRSLYGPYLLSTYNWSIATNATAAIHLDYRVKRGVGGGPDLHYDLGSVGAGSIRTYVMHDNEPGVDPANRPIPEDRHRIAFAHSAVLRTNLTARVVLNEQSDAYILHDFFESEYRRDIMPKSFLEVQQAWSNFTLDLLAQPQVNDFYETIERLPDLRLTGLRQQLGSSPFYYESDSSAGYFRHSGGDFAAATNYAALRADTYHQILLPHTAFGWLNLTPRVGGRYTAYGDQEGVGSTLDATDRWVFNTGAEVSTKASRLWPGACNRTLDVTGLRHIFEPSVNYVYVPSPTQAPPRLPQFDYEFYNFEMLPVDFPDYNSIDSVDSQNVFRLGLRNKLQTKRQGQVDNLLNWALFTDWRVRPRHDQRTYGDVYSDIDFKPRSWLTFNSEVRYDINTTTWRMANHTATLEPNDWWSWKVGHRYLFALPGEGPESGNNLILSSLAFRLNENWAIRLRHHFEARDGTLEEQYYTVYRDFRSFTAALTVRLRDNRIGSDDFTIAISISLKAFPRFHLNQDRDEPSLLLGG
jgi:lipopolysaccharide assembly outer membrane protein LptD (OstA)